MLLLVSGDIELHHFGNNAIISGLFWLQICPNQIVNDENTEETRFFPVLFIDDMIRTILQIEQTGQLMFSLFL